VDAALESARKPGDVLRVLAQQNSWSFRVTVPKTVQVPVRNISTSAMEKIAEERVLKAYAKAILPTSATKSTSVPRSRTKGARLSSGSIAAVPPAWMTPTKFWHAPLAA